MPPRSPEPLRRITLNLFEADCVSMERRYGHGWTERVREMVQKHVRLTSVSVEHCLDIDEISQIYADELEEDNGQG